MKIENEMKEIVESIVEKYRVDEAKYWDKFSNNEWHNQNDDEHMWRAYISTNRDFEDELVNLEDGEWSVQIQDSDNDEDDITKGINPDYTDFNRYTEYFNRYTEDWNQHSQELTFKGNGSKNLNSLLALFELPKFNEKLD